MTERTKLKKSFKPHWVWAIAFGSTIGWGSFVLPAQWISQAGPLGVIIGFLLGAAIMWPLGLCASWLVRSFPVSGGAFTFTYLGFGRNHAFVCGWFLILGHIAILALNASAMGLLIKFLFPEIVKTGFLYTVYGWNVYLGQIVIASCALLIFAWLNIRGAGLSGRSQFVFCVVLIGAALLVTLGMLLAPSTSFDNFDPLFKPELSPWAAIAVIVAVAPWAYGAFDSVPQAAEEFNFSSNKATLLIIGALAASAIHYIIMIMATTLGLPWTELAARHEAWGTGYAIQSALGYAGLAVLAVALSMGIFTGLIGFYISTSRLMFAMSRAKALPSVFSRLHKKHKTPYGGIIFACAICLMAPWFGRSVLGWIVNASSIGIIIAYFYYCTVSYKRFAWHSAVEGDSFKIGVAPYKKATSLLGALFCIGFLCLLVVPISPAAMKFPSWIMLIAWALLGMTFYFYGAKRYKQLSDDELDKLMLGEQAVFIREGDDSGEQVDFTISQTAGRVS